jgi:hypothetical protein
LHTCRGRLGADVAILVRRLRERTRDGRAPLCIGTSATMANEGEASAIQATVAEVASRFFCTPINADAVIGETLTRASDDRLRLEDIRPLLPEAIRSPLSAGLPDQLLATHPLAVWAEMALGLEDEGGLKRCRPIAFDATARRLAANSGLPTDQCSTTLQSFLTRTSLPETS